jgi:hypothetical protein
MALVRASLLKSFFDPSTVILQILKECFHMSLVLSEVFPEVPFKITVFTALQEELI